MASKAPRHWGWIVVMVLATAWYAWPQVLYSLLPVYDLVLFLFPELGESLRPWVEGLRSMTRG